MMEEIKFEVFNLCVMYEEEHWERDYFEGSIMFLMERFRLAGRGKVESEKIASGRGIGKGERIYFHFVLPLLMPPIVETLNIRTHNDFDIVNITSQVNQVVKKSKVKEGQLIVFTPHTTTAITVNEDEPGLISDIMRKISEIVPKGAGYSHDRIDNNAHSHILGSIIGCSVTLPIINGRAGLGTWQSILFIELDGPRNRNVVVQIN